MSQPTVIQDGLHCSNCGRFCSFKPCQSNKNGNQGVMFATCHSANSQGVPCSFVRRASKSPSASPTLPSATFPGQPLVALAVVKQALGKCPAPNCGQSRLAEDCPRRVCRKHCVEQGGCLLKTHKAPPRTAPATESGLVLQQAPPALLPPPTVLPPPPTAPDFPPTQTTTYSVPFSSDRSPSPEVDARADPRFTSHLRPIFTTIVAEQQEKARQQTLLDAERKENAQKAKQRIAVYPWTTEHTAPIIKFFQGFTWPYLTITSALLTAVGLLEASERGNLRMYDEMEVFDWVAIDVGYVIEVREGQRLFLKDAAIHKCFDFEKYLDTQPNRTPHLHLRLARERSYVRDMHKSMSYPQGLATSSSLQQQPIHLEPTPSPSTSPSPAPSPVASLLPSSAQTPNAGNNSVAPAGDSEKHWPTDFYTIDVSKCIRESKARSHRAHHRGRNQATVFSEHFPNVRFVPSTFSEQISLWNGASSALREEFIDLGRSKEGLWPAFARRARQDKKARLGKSQTVIEID